MARRCPASRTPFWARICPQSLRCWFRRHRRRMNLHLDGIIESGKDDLEAAAGQSAPIGEPAGVMPRHQRRDGRRAGPGLSARQPAWAASAELHSVGSFAAVFSLFSNSFGKVCVEAGNQRRSVRPKRLGGSASSRRQIQTPPGKARHRTCECPCSETSSWYDGVRLSRRCRNR